MKQEYFKIIGRTNSFIAQRDSLFRGKTEIILADGLQLREAQEKLLSFYNEDNGTCYTNWGLVRCNDPYNTSTHKDGTRRYEHDSRIYEIEKS